MGFRSVDAIRNRLVAAEQDLQSVVLDEQGGDVRSVRLVPLLANVRDASRMDEILRTWKPHTVYHAAAYKHVPLVEHNPAEGVKNNVLGTLNTAQLAAVHGVNDFVLISTDKAVRPTKSPLQNPCNPYECWRSGVIPNVQNSQRHI